MKKYARMAAVLAVVAWAAVSCGKEKDSAAVSFDRPALYLAYGQSETVSFSVHDVRVGTLSIASKPDGWDGIALDAAARTVTVVAPSAGDAEAAASGSIVLSGTSDGGGSTASATLFVGVVESEDLSARPANSFLLNKKETNYLFDATTDGRSPLATARVGVIWQSATNLVQYLDFDASSGKASFYVGADSEGNTKEGNALIGAYDAHDKLLWSWHAWISDFDPDAEGGSVDFNSYTLMNRNLGARANANSDAAEILASFGLFYQWGRKEPFIGPSVYNAANGTSAAMYDGNGSRAYMKTAESDSETGTMKYALQNPLTYILVAEKEADWLQSGGGERWAADAKTLYDPCPYGWRIAPPAAFADLSICESLAADAGYAAKFGWTLGDAAGAQSFFMAAGRRSWYDASVQNYFDESLLSRAAEMQPWVGYYWTGGADAALSPAFCFWLKADEVAASGLWNARPMGRANGMQVRCVRDE